MDTVLSDNRKAYVIFVVFFMKRDECTVWEEIGD